MIFRNVDGEGTSRAILPTQRWRGSQDACVIGKGFICCCIFRKISVYFSLLFSYYLLYIIYYYLVSVCCSVDFRQILWVLNAPWQQFLHLNPPADFSGCFSRSVLSTDCGLDFIDLDLTGGGLQWQREGSALEEQ